MKPQDLKSNIKIVHKVRYYFNHEEHEAHEDFIYKNIKKEYLLNGVKGFLNHQINCFSFVLFVSFVVNNLFPVQTKSIH